MSSDSPRYPEQNQAVFERAFPQISELLHASELDAVVSDYSHRAPRLTSKHPAHPTAVKYAVKFSPTKDLDMVSGNPDALVKIDVLDPDKDDPVSREEALDTLYAHTGRFTDVDFRVTTHGMYEVFYYPWNVTSANLSDEAFLDEVADRLVQLVTIGHGVFLDE